MTTTDSPVGAPADLSVEPTHPTSAPPPIWTGDATVVGLPAFVVGSLTLGLALVGAVPATAIGGVLPILFAATSLGLLIATIWAAVLGQSAVAGVFGTFTGFWASYAVLVLALTHGWLGVSADAVTSTQELFLVSWMIVIIVLGAATLRLPSAFTAIFGLAALALLLILMGTSQGSTGLVKTGGVLVLAFAAIGAYLFYGAMSVASGGPAMSAGKPLMR